MAQEVFSLHNVTGNEDVLFPFAIKDYQRYIFGDDKLAHRFGTDLAKSIIVRGPGLETSKKSCINDVAVAVLSGQVPTATHSLRNHFVAYLNRHLISLNARLALKVDIYGVEDDLEARIGPGNTGTRKYNIDLTRLGGRSLIILADIRTSGDREQELMQSLRDLGIETSITFAYLASFDEPANAAALSPIFSFVISPLVKEVESIAQARCLVMNECFVRYLLGQEYAEFSKFVRGQDDQFARVLLEYAIEGLYHDDKDYEHNVKFLLWEVEARESI